MKTYGSRESCNAAGCRTPLRPARESDAKQIPPRRGPPGRHRFESLGILSAGASARAAERDAGSPRWDGRTEHYRYRISARIRRDPSARTPALDAGFRRLTASAREADEVPGQPEASLPDFGSATARPSSALPASPEPADGSSVRFPDLELPQAEVLEETDPILGMIGYHPTIAQGGAAPSGFGVTRPYNFSLSGISVTSALGTYFVSAVVENPIRYQVRASTGPNSQVDIDSATDPDIRASNYTSVVSDLTPDYSDLSGRPPRNGFWSKDLTIRHERFHCTDGRGHAARGALLASGWLTSQTASSTLGVYALLAQVPGRVANTRRAAMTWPGREQRAYADGAPYYLARALHVSLRGATGQYP